jgi:hypothetical protein
MSIFYQHICYITSRKITIFFNVIVVTIHVCVEPFLISYFSDDFWPIFLLDVCDSTCSILKE